jgi:hypothetical protein
VRSETGTDTSVPVVILKMTRDCFGNGRLGVPVSCLHESRRAPASFSRSAREHTWELNDVPADPS